MELLTCIVEREPEVFDFLCLCVQLRPGARAHISSRLLLSIFIIQRKYLDVQILFISESFHVFFGVFCLALMWVDCPDLSHVCFKTWSIDKRSFGLKAMRLAIRCIASSETGQL